MNAFDFTSLIWPVPPATFFRDTWEKQHLVISRNEPSYYSRLFSLSDVDAVISFTKPRFTPLSELRQEGPRRQTETVVRGLSAGSEYLSQQRQPDLFDLSDAYNQGKTILVHSLQRRCQPVAAFCRNLEALLHHAVQANMYLTPRGAQAFPAHSARPVCLANSRRKKHE